MNSRRELALFERVYSLYENSEINIFTQNKG